MPLCQPPPALSDANFGLSELLHWSTDNTCRAGGEAGLGGPITRQPDATYIAEAACLILPEPR